MKLTEQVLAMIGRPEGATVPEMADECGVDEARITNALNAVRFKRANRAPSHTRKLPGMLHRMFLSREHADAWVAASNKLAADTIARRDARYRAANTELKRAAREADAVLARKARLDADVRKVKDSYVGSVPASVEIARLLPAVVSTNPNGVTKTVQPMLAWCHRYQVDPKARIVGGFATLGIGRYLDALPFPSPGAHSPGPFFVAD